MADKRKLLGDIDRCHKKVAEGVESFKETWKKLQQASNQNQKEKYEQDLKKEIKKLQRLRDQIKTWCASNEVKDKRSLMEDRKLIEHQMETFKIVERDSKTKAYSKEALGLPTKVDPAEKEKHDLRDWLNKTIESLNIEIDKLEADVECLQAQTKKGKNKDRYQDKLDELQEFIKKHRWHTAHLEALLRMLDNDNIETVDVKNIQEDVNFYLSDYRDPDFIDNEYLYSDIVDPDVLNNSIVDPRLGIGESDNEDDGDSNMDDSISHISHDSHAMMQMANDFELQHQPTSPTTKATPKQNKAQSSSQAPRSRHPTPNNNSFTNSSSNSSTSSSTSSSIPPSVSTPSQQQLQQQQQQQQQLQQQPAPVHLKPPVTKSNSNSLITPPTFTSTPATSTTSSLYTTHHMSSTESVRSPPSVIQTSLPPSLPPSENSQSPEEDLNQEAFVFDPVLGVCPLGPIPLTPERSMQLEMLEAAAMNLPLPSDSNRLRSLTLINGYPNAPVSIPPHHYHSYDPKHNFDSYEYFKNLVPDTLFFIFYFYEGTKAQYYAAKALKDQHWRFHKKHKMWFQR